MSRTPTQPKRSSILATSVAALLSLGLLLSAPRAAADEYWDGTNTGGSGTPNGAGGDGTWDNVTTNWVDPTGTVPMVYDSTMTAHFATMAGTVTLGDNITFTALSFDVDGYTINQDAGGAFSLTPNAGATITVGSGNTATINAPITGAGDITVPGSGTLVLTGSSSYTGGTTLTGGTLTVNNNSALGSGPVNINGGTIGTTLAGGVNIPNPVTVGGDFSVSTTGVALGSSFTFSGPVNLGATTHTITGLTPGSQVEFSNVISGTAGVTFTTGAAVAGDPSVPYVAFIYSDSLTTTSGGGDPGPNTYTGLTTVTGNAILVLEKSTPNGAIQGDVDIEGNGVVDYIGGANLPEQIADTSTVTVNSPGNPNVSGTSFAGLELRGASDTIGTLNGTNSLATVGLGSGTLTISVGGNFAGIIEDGAFGTGGNLTLDTTAAGTLVLSGANTYTGLTTITQGILQAGAINTFSAASPVLIDTTGTLDLNNFNQTVAAISDPLNGDPGGTINLGTATLTFGSDGIDTSFSGVIQGMGGITKVGTGTFSIEGNANTFTGPTTINAGAIVLDGTSMSPVIVNSTGTFNLDPTGTLNTGPGTTPVTVNSGGAFNNFGTLSVAGAISEVHLTGDTALAENLPGATISGATAVLVDNPTGVAILINYGAIAGTTASVNALNSAGVTIGDFGPFTGPVELGTGTNTVIIGTQIPYSPIAGGAGSHDTLELAGGGADTLRLTDFPGYEFLNKVGGGLWTLTGANPFSGGTMISGGTLNVQGTLTSNTVVQSMGTLSGSGTVVGNVTNFGTVMPGTPSSILTPTVKPGTLSIRGNYNQTPGAALVIQVNGHNSGQYSQLSITGHAQLSGTLVLQINDTKLNFGQQISILTATAGVSGKFSDVTNPLANNHLDFGNLIYEPNAVVLEGPSFLSLIPEFNLTYNQTAVARALDSAATDPRATKLLAYLNSRPLKDLPSDFDHIAPEEMASVFRVGVSLADVQARNVQRRTADLRAGASGFSAAGFQTTGGPNYSGGLAGANGSDGANGKAVNAPASDQRWGTFISGVGDFAHVGNSGNANGYDLDTGGVTVGADYRVNDHLALGVTTGYAGTNANLTEDGRLLVNGGKVGAYGTYFTGGFHTDAALTGGFNNYSTRRSALQGDAIGATEGGELDVLADAGYDWRLDALTIGPTAAFQYTYVGIDGFTERGSLAPLRYMGQHQSSIRSTFGLRMAYDWKVGNVIIRPEGEFSWQHEYGDRSYSIESAFASGAGSPFSVADTPLGRDSLLFGGGVSVLWNPRTSTYLFYDADLLKKDYYSQSVTGGLRMNF